jgi:glycosyltransferase involved in cell wall biosynthesis
VIPAIPSLRILMLAPEPFFEPRGTPFSEYHRIKALVEQGHHVDLVTYPIGADVDLPNLRIIRSAPLPFVKKVPIGPSATKVFLDALLTVTALRQAMKQSYDAIHSHEEAGILGVWLSRRLGIPHLYDMHSSLPQQLTNFKFTRSSLLTKAFESAESYMVNGSKVVITICQELQDTVEKMGVGDRSVLIENVMGGDVEAVAGPGRDALRAKWGIEADAPLLLYTGTFEAYQGLELLLASVARLQKTHPHARQLIVGGHPEQVEELRARAAALGANVVCTGQRPPNEIPHFVEACDILVSPRISGTNTPLKIYSYLRSGKPIVATNLLTHTQVLSDATAVLVDTKPDAFAAALARLIDHPEERVRISTAAAALAASRYSRDAYLTRTHQAYVRLMDGIGGFANGARLVASEAAASADLRAGGTKLP